MFVGHYSFALAIKSKDKSIPLWTLFLAVQFVDILWASFVFAGIEKVSIEKGFTASNPLNLFYMPFTHSLIGAVGWALLAAFGYFLWKRQTKSALFVGVAVISHWLLDFLVHRPDLGIIGDSHKVGLGLWDFPLIALPLEIGILIVSLWLYLKSITSNSAVGKYGMIIFVALLILLQFASIFGPNPTSPTEFALTGLAFYLVFAGVAMVLEKYRN